MYLLYLDLQEIESVFSDRWLWSCSRPAIGRFRRTDFHGDPNLTIDQCVRETVRQQAGITATGPIRLLAHLRYFGLIANPVSFYFCFDPDGEQLQAVLAEVTNTPWHQRHCYVLPGPPDGKSKWKHRCDKEFHVSPFLPMQMQYRWRLTVPGKQLTVAIQNWDEHGLAFEASLALHRRPIDGAGLARVLLRYPAMTLRVVTGIYWQAARLWMKKVTFLSHPQLAAEAKSETNLSKTI